MINTVQLRSTQNNDQLTMTIVDYHLKKISAYMCICIYAVCGGVVRSQQAFITIGADTDTSSTSYANNVSCTWFIHSQPGRTIRLSFEYLNIYGNQGECGGDYVEVCNHDL